MNCMPAHAIQVVVNGPEPLSPRQQRMQRRAERIAAKLARAESQRKQANRAIRDLRVKRAFIEALGYGVN